MHEQAGIECANNLAAAETMLHRGSLDWVFAHYGVKPICGRTVGADAPGVKRFSRRKWVWVFAPDKVEAAGIEPTS